METKTLCACLVLSLLMAIPLGGGEIANIIYVDADAPGANDGTSWFNAFNYLQDALASARPGSTIRVAKGTYYPNQGMIIPPPNGPMGSFQMLSGVTIMGGYAGYGTAKPWERNLTQYETVLSGDLLGNDVPLNLNVLEAQLLDGPDRQDNAFSVVTASGVEANGILDGVTISGGNARVAEDKFPYANARGGGLYAHGGSPTIRNCTFKGNASVGGGGGIYNYMTEAIYDNCTVYANYSAAEGGGMFNFSADPEVKNCTFIKNQVYAQADGGGMHNFDSNPTIHKCIFSENDGGYHGGGMYNAYSDAVVTQCQFIGNVSHQRGGGVYNATGSTAEFIDCEIRQNQAPEWGGGMVNYFCAPTLVNCIFQGNEANIGAGLYDRFSESILINSLFHGNAALLMGGAFGCNDAATQIINCTFWSNHAPRGRSIACSPGTGPKSNSRLQISNSILWNPGNEIYNGDNSEILIRYSNIHGGWPGPGNIQANPLFTDPIGPDHTPGTDDDNLRLASGSPAIDAGDNGRVPNDITMDLDDEPRFQEDPSVPNTGLGIAPIVDMGPYEMGHRSGGGGSNRPVANAGPSQTVYARVNGQATVNLDGSGSYDPDGDALQYFWHWNTDNTPQQANGVSPQIQMPVGKQVVQLIVSDGIHFSDPDDTNIHVVEAMQADTWIWPYEVSRSSSDAYINVYLTLVGITQDQINQDRSLIMYPGTIKAAYLHVSQTNDGVPTTTLFGMFDKFELLDVVPQNGVRTLTIAGRLNSSQYISGQDDIEIVP